MNLSDVTQDYRERAAITDFVRLLSCCAQTGGREQAGELFAQRWPHSLHVDIIRKAAVPPGNTTDVTWGSPLMVPTLANAFLAIVRTSSLLGRIRDLQRVPFNTLIPAETGGGTFYWVSENTPKPVSKLGFANVSLAPLKCAGIVVVSKELARLTTPGTEPALRRELVSGLTAFTDKSFLDPASGAVPGRPASVTNGVVPITTTGTLDGDVGAVLGALYSAHPGANPVLIASPSTVSKLAGTGLNREAKVPEGVVHGVPLLASEAAGANLVALDPANVLLADGGVTVDVSQEASVQLNDAPVGDATAIITSLWQTSQIGFLTERIVNWRALAGSVQYVVVA